MECLICKRNSQAWVGTNLLKQMEVGLQRAAEVQGPLQEAEQKYPVWGFWKMNSALRLLYYCHYLAISVTERMTPQKPPHPLLPVLRWNLSSGLEFELHFRWRSYNLKNCYKAKFITIIITIPLLTDGQLRQGGCYLFKVTKEIMAEPRFKHKSLESKPNALTTKRFFFPQIVQLALCFPSAAGRGWHSKSFQLILLA